MGVGHLAGHGELGEPRIGRRLLSRTESAWIRLILRLYLGHEWFTGAAFWAWAVTLGEALVGLGLIVGLFTGSAAFFGGSMSFNYRMARTVSSNPLSFVIASGRVLAWTVAGWYGLDRWVLPALGTPWQPGPAFQHRH